MKSLFLVMMAKEKPPITVVGDVGGRIAIIIVRCTFPFSIILQSICCTTDIRWTQYHQSIVFHDQSWGVRFKYLQHRAASLIATTSAPLHINYTFLLVVCHMIGMWSLRGKPVHRVLVFILLFEYNVQNKWPLWNAIYDLACYLFLVIFLNFTHSSFGG